MEATKKKKPISHFDKCYGRIELYLENDLIHSNSYTSFKQRQAIIDQWNREVRNIQHRKNIYYKIIPK